MKKSLLAATFLSLMVSGLFAESAIASGYEHQHGPKLIVDVNKGTVDRTDPCPTPRKSAIYLKLEAAVRCAKSGDTILIAPGRHGVAHPVGPTHWEGIEIPDIRLTIIGAGPNQTSLHGGYLVDISIDRARVTFIGLTVDSAGIFNNKGVVVIKNCVFIGNTAGVDNLHGRVKIFDSIFTRNEPGVNNSGTMKIFDTVFTANQGDPYSGEMGGAIVNGGDGSLKLIRNTIVGNEAASGGGIFNTDNASLTVVKSLFSGNSGGGIYNESTKPMVLRRTVIPDWSCYGCP